MNIRSWRYKDIDEIVDMMVDFSREESKCDLLNGNLNRSRNITTGIITHLHNGSIELLVAEENDRLAGYTLLNRDHPEYTKALVIEEIFTKPQYRRRGIARRLTESAIEYAKKNRIKELYTEVRERNIANTKNNQKLGFTIKARDRRGDSYYLLFRKYIDTARLIEEVDQ
ncbi:GNAT family N-acetyltransferase [Candidatus Woesearchaeota archaeon]|nr:GNAT family N-acetyltransferase [Candidatus Woesearchaeota archaeon]